MLKIITADIQFVNMFMNFYDIWMNFLDRHIKIYDIHSTRGKESKLQLAKKRPLAVGS